MRKVIPIQPASAVASRDVATAAAPRLDGDARALVPLVEAVAGEISAPGGPLEGGHEVGAWLRAFRLRDGEAEMHVAGDLGACGAIVAACAFDVLRRRLRDTDIFVVVDCQAPGPERRAR